MVTKILNYDQNPPAGSWREHVLFVADDPDAAGDFYTLSNLIADSSYFVPPPMQADKVYYPSGKNADVKTRAERWAADCQLCGAQRDQFVGGESADGRQCQHTNERRQTLFYDAHDVL